MLLTSDEKFLINKALVMSMGFLTDTGKQAEAEEMRQLMKLFFYVERVDVKLSPGEAENSLEKMNEILRQRQQNLKEKEASNVFEFPNRNQE